MRGAIATLLGLVLTGCAQDMATRQVDALRNAGWEAANRCAVYQTAREQVHCSNLVILNAAAQFDASTVNAVMPIVEQRRQLGERVMSGQISMAVGALENLQYVQAALDVLEGAGRRYINAAAEKDRQTVANAIMVLGTVATAIAMQRLNNTPQVIYTPPSSNGYNCRYIGRGQLDCRQY